MPSANTLIKNQRAHETKLAYMTMARDLGASALSNPYLSVVIAGAVVSLGAGVMAWLAMNAGSKFISDLNAKHGITSSWSKMSFLEKLGVTTIAGPSAMPALIGYNAGDAAAQNLLGDIDARFGELNRKLAQMALQLPFSPYEAVKTGKEVVELAKTTPYISPAAKQLKETGQLSSGYKALKQVSAPFRGFANWLNRVFTVGKK